MDRAGVVKPLLSVRRDKRRAVQSGGGGGGGGGGGSALFWNPAVVANLGSSFNTYTIPVTGNYSIQLAPGERARFVLPSDQVKQGQVFIQGWSGSGNVIQMIGGSIRHTTQTTSGNGHVALDLLDLDTCYVEGVKVDHGGTIGDCIVVRQNNSGSKGSPQSNNAFGTYYLQNILSVGNGYDGSAIHGDNLQMQTRIRQLNVDMFTYYTCDQGVILNFSGATRNLRRFNGRGYPNASSPCVVNDPNAILYLADGCSQASSMIYNFSECYIWDPNGVKTLATAIANNTLTNSGSSCGQAPVNNVWTPRASLGWTGTVSWGVPPTGDFVPTTFTGLNYTSPGYQ